MPRTIVSALLCIGIAGAAAFASSDSSAGQQGPAWDQCGPGYCEGTLLGFRQDANGSNLAEFNATSSTTWNFFAIYDNSTYACSVPSTNTALGAMSIQAITNRVFFRIYFDGSGNCTSLQVTNSSGLSGSF